MELKGIIHCHSTYSYDAKLSLVELKELCQKNGVKFVCMTEHTDELTHERAMEFIEECKKLSDNNFLFIPGFEVPYKVKEVNGEAREAGLGHTGSGEGALGYKHAHILMIGMREFYETYAPSIEILKKWTEKAAFVVLAHPVRNQFLVDDGLLNEIDALEVWNQQYEGKRVPRTRSLTLLKILRTVKPLLLATGGVDFHRKEHFGAPFISLSVDSFTEQAIIEKLQTGAFVVSSSQTSFFGTIPNIDEVRQKHRLESVVSVSVIVLGKCVNKALAAIGISLPRQLKEYIRKKL